MGLCKVVRQDGRPIDRQAASDALNEIYKKGWEHVNGRPEQNGFLYEVNSPSVRGIQIKNVIAPFFPEEQHQFQID